MERQAQVEYLLEHYENPRHRRTMDGADVSAEGGNPGCGDILHIYLKFDGDRLDEISFDGEGCTISQASADILAERVGGMTVEELEAFSHEELMEILGQEIVQNRTKCAMLSLDTLKMALRKRYEQAVRQGQ